MIAARRPIRSPTPKVINRKPPISEPAGVPLPNTWLNAGVREPGVARSGRARRTRDDIPVEAVEEVTSHATGHHGRMDKAAGGLRCSMISPTSTTSGARAVVRRGSRKHRRPTGMVADSGVSLNEGSIGMAADCPADWRGRRVVAHAAARTNCGRVATDYEIADQLAALIDGQGPTRLERRESGDVYKRLAGLDPRAKSRTNPVDELEVLWRVVLSSVGSVG